MPDTFVVKIYNSKINKEIRQSVDATKGWKDYRNILKEVQKSSNDLLTTLVQDQSSPDSCEIDNEDDSSEDEDTLKKISDSSCSPNKKARLK